MNVRSRPTVRTGWLLGVGMPVATAGAAAATWAVVWDRLPDPVATHWSVSGRPDGHMAPATALAVTVGLPAAAAVALVAAAAFAGRGEQEDRRKADDRGERWTAIVATTGLLGFVVVLLSGASLSTALANAGAATWRDARLSPAAVVGLVAAALALGGLGTWAVTGIARPGRGRAAVGAGGPPTMALREDERAAWTGGSRWRWGPALVAAWAAAAVATTPIAPRILVASLVALAVLTAGLTSVRVSAGAHGLRVRPGLVPWPALVLPLDRIESATAIEVRPMAWGGWGYRGSLHLLRRAAWVLRRGPGLQVDLRDGRVFVVTVDEPGDAAAVLNGLLAQEHHPGDR